MADKDFREPRHQGFGARRGPSHPHPQSNGYLPSLLPGAAAEHEQGLGEAEADAAYRWIAPAAVDRDVLDVGCRGQGAGTLLDAGARSYVGTDPDPAEIERAARADGDRARFVVAEPTALPLAPGSFGLVLCFDALETHLGSAETLLERLAGMLGEGGLLVVSLPTAPRQDPIGGGLVGEFRSPEDWHALLTGTLNNVTLVRRRSSLAAAVLPADSEPEMLERARWLGADPGEERSVLALASDAALPELEPVATLVGARDLRAYRETILAWEHRARRAEADGAAKHWELVASREAQRRLRKRLWHLEHTPLRKLFRMLRGKPARLTEGPPIRPPEAEPERWD